MEPISYWFKRYQKFKFFLGKRVWGLFRISFVVGFFWFLIESSFIFVLQGFLIAIGIMDPKSSILPSFFPTTIWWAIAALFFFGLLRSVALTLRQFYAESTNQAFVRIQRERIIEFALVNSSEFSTHGALNIFGERIPATAAVIQNLSTVVNGAVASFCFLLLGLRLAPIELAVGLSALFLLFLCLRFINKHISELGRKIVVESRRLTETLVLGLRNNFLLKIYDLTGQEVDRGVAAAAAYEGHYKKYIFMGALKAAFPQFAGVLVVSLVSLISIQYIHTPSVKLISFIYIFMRLAQGMSESASILASVRLNWDSFTELYRWHLRGEEFFLGKEKSAAQRDAGGKHPKLGLNKIEAEKVSFHHAGGLELFRNLSFSVGEGDILLLKGRSGSGKSTLLTLLLGILRPTAGRILINGVSAGELRSEVAPLTGYVGPEPYMIQGSLRTNLTYASGLGSVPDEDLWAVLKEAQLFDIASRLGLDRELAEVAELSTGQKQRLSIARALLRKPKILILDEATANLDSATEAEIISMIKRASEKMIVIVVSHKNSFDAVSTKVIELAN